MFAKGLDILPAHHRRRDRHRRERRSTPPSPAAPAACRSTWWPASPRAARASSPRPDLTSRSMADLKGRKVGVARGGAQELLLLAELAKHGLTWSDQPGKDVQISFLPFADLNQALHAEEYRRHVPVRAAVLAGDQQGLRRGAAQALRHAAGRAGAGAGDDREDVQREAATSPSACSSASSTPPGLSSGRSRAGREIRARADVQGPDQRPGLSGTRWATPPSPTMSA